MKSRSFLPSFFLKMEICCLCQMVRPLHFSFIYLFNMEFRINETIRYRKLSFASPKFHYYIVISNQKHSPYAKYVMGNPVP